MIKYAKKFFEKTIKGIFTPVNIINHTDKILNLLSGASSYGSEEYNEKLQNSI